MIMPLKGFMSNGQNENFIFNNKKCSCHFESCGEENSADRKHTKNACIASQLL